MLNTNNSECHCVNNVTSILINFNYLLSMYNYNETRQTMINNVSCTEVAENVLKSSNFTINNQRVALRSS